MAGLRHPDWHQFASRCFRRRSAVSSSAQVFRGEAYLVLSDKLGGQHLRLGGNAQDLWAALDGRRSLQTIWEDMMTRPWAAPTQDEMVSWILQLLQSGMILSDQETSGSHISRRNREKVSSRLEQRAISPLAIKVPLFDPDPIVRAIWPVARLLFTRTGAAVVVAVHLVAIVLALAFGGALMAGGDSALLSQSGVIGLLLVYPLMKVLHELSHCLMLYRFGGRVREAGVMLLLFFPVPYVDASEANALPDKRARMLVGAAGIIAETLMASFAFCAWLMIEPGVERALLFNVILIGTASTLLFNGNPLLKFDAYYVLSDWLEMPNLAQRSADFLSDRFLTRVAGLRSEGAAVPGTQWILGLYGVLSLGYRMVLTLTIALLVSSWFFILGIVLALWSVIMAVVWPLVRLMRKGGGMAKSQNRTGRALARVGLFAAIVVVVVGVIPLPFMATGQGRVVPRQETQIVAGTSGLLAEVIVPEGGIVAPHSVVARLAAPQLQARRAALDVSRGFLEQSAQLGGLQPLERQRVLRELAVTTEALADADRQLAALDVTASEAGRMSWVGGAAPAAGGYVMRGDMLGHVIAPHALDLVLAMPVAYAGVARDEAGVISLHMPDGNVIAARALRQQVIDVGGAVPPELLARAGGPVPEQADNPGHALTAVWVIWAAADDDLSTYAGMRPAAKLDMGWRPLGAQVLFQIERLFLRVQRL